MNLKSLVSSLSFEEQTELLDILMEFGKTGSGVLMENEGLAGSTMPPHIVDEFGGSVSSDFQVKKQNNLSKKRKEAVRANKNTWKDTGEDRHIETPAASITPRNRSKPKKTTVTCHKCGKESKINAGLVYGEFYRCDKCIG